MNARRILYFVVVINQPKKVITIRNQSNLKDRNQNSALFFSPQFRNRFGSPQYCGTAEVRTKIADAHLVVHTDITTVQQICIVNNAISLRHPIPSK
jgi:hypothetical protein